MSLPIGRQLQSELTPKRIRIIESEYNLELTAQNTGQIAAQQAQLLGLQAQAAEMTLRGLGEIARRNDENSERMDLRLSEIVAGIDQLTEVTGEGFAALQDTLSSGLQMVADELQNISQQLWQQQQTLDQIVELLRNPYGAQVQELLRDADRWLKLGAKHSGRDRDEDWKQAMRRLQDALKNPIGEGDYVAWFQFGWLQWKHKEDIGAAEEAFFQAQRVSSDAQPAFHIKSLRHQAYMQDLLGRPEDAWQTISKARQVSEDHDTLYDAARYAAKTGRKEESLKLLDRCIDLQPTTIITIFSEVDFQ